MVGWDGSRGIKFRLMSEQQRANDDQTKNVKYSASDSEIFAPKKSGESGMPLKAWAVAGLVVLAVVVVLVLAGRRKTTGAPNMIQPLAVYAANLPLSQLAMSESTSLSGGKSTFVDGRVKNTGSQTVTGITVQVLFRNEEGMPPQVETLPMSLIRTREPYIDTQAVGAAPLKPGDEREFRLIFEAIPGNWNMQMPEVHLVRVDTR
ncbi:MAG: hypothetical protein JWQ42_1868 [Edaphobacter sp.]|nr:hypothetical protein [Edaphobacter sp.]